jgi:hypothetical protein
VVIHLLCKYKALSSKPSPTKKKKKENEIKKTGKNKAMNTLHKICNSLMFSFSLSVKPTIFVESYITGFNYLKYLQEKYICIEQYSHFLAIIPQTII